MTICKTEGHGFEGTAWVASIASFEGVLPVLHR